MILLMFLLASVDHRCVVQGHIRLTATDWTDKGVLTIQYPDEHGQRRQAVFEVDEFGHFECQLPSSTLIRLEASHPGYSEFSVLVDWIPNSLVEIELVLAPTDSGQLSRIFSVVNGEVFELAALRDEVRALMEDGEFQEARLIIHSAITRFEHYVLQLKARVIGQALWSTEPEWQLSDRDWRVLKAHPRWLLTDQDLAILLLKHEGDIKNYEGYLQGYFGLLETFMAVRRFEDLMYEYERVNRISDAKRIGEWLLNEYPNDKATVDSVSQELRAIGHIGQQPSLAFRNTSGSTWTEQELKGQWTLVYFFQSWCGSCLETVVYLKAQMQAFDELEVEIVSVCADRDVSWIKSFSQKHDLGWPLLSAYGTDATERFGVGPAQVYMVDPNGTFVGFPDFWHKDRVGLKEMMGFFRQHELK